jgi:glycosyltransferase involved in cell wall biosynthesis
MSEILVSILFATYKRDSILRTTLDALTRLDNAAFKYEIIVIDNACEKRVSELVDTYRELLPISYVDESASGKNAALTKGLRFASGKILVFIDDDIVASPSWLNELVAGAERNPGYDLFGGRILPYLSADVIDKHGLLNVDDDFIKSAYGIADWKMPEGPVSTGKIWGGNMAVRRSVFEAGINFNPALGPAGNNYIMCGDTEFLERAAHHGFKGLYLPEALVYHQIRQEQLNIAWIKSRAFKYGRGVGRRKPPAMPRKVLGVPLYHLKKYLCTELKNLFGTRQHNEKFVKSIIGVHMQRGFIYQLWKDRGGKK